MKRIAALLMAVVALTVSANAMTYEEAFEAVKAMPNMKGVEGTEISGGNDFAAIGMTDAQFILWDNERGGNETEAYGNRLYQIIGELPVSEMVQARMYGGSMFAIFAKPISEHSNRIIILSDSAGDGFTGAIIGKISDSSLEAFRNAIIIPRPTGGMAVYLNVLNF